MKNKIFSSYISIFIVFLLIFFNIIIPLTEVINLYRNGKLWLIEESFCLVFPNPSCFSNVSLKIIHYQQKNHRDNYQKLINFAQLKNEDFYINSQTINAYFVHQKPSQFLNSEKQLLSELYYTAGINSPNHEKAEKYLLISILLNPDLSYMYGELANFYKQSNRFEQAYELFNLCQNFNYPQKHCQEMSAKLTTTRWQEEYADNFRKIISDYYQQRNQR